MKTTYAHHSEASGTFTDKFGHTIISGDVQLMRFEEANGVRYMIETLKIPMTVEVVEFAMYRGRTLERFAVEVIESSQLSGMEGSTQ